MKKLLTVILILISITASYAGDVSRKGTTGADQLLIPVGARSIATSGAFVSNTLGAEAIYYNPAGLDPAGKSEAMFSYMKYIGDLNISYFAAVANLGSLGSLGLSFKSIDFGDIDVTTNTEPDGTGSTYSPDYYVLGLSYSKIITDRVSAGANFKLIHEGIMNTSANGFAVDFGVQYRFNPNFTLGVTVMNIGTNMRYTGPDLQTKTNIPGADPNSPVAAYEPVTEEFEIPAYFMLSAAYKFDINPENSVLVGSTFKSNNALEDQINIGAEYNFSNMFFVRAGYDFLLQNADEYIYGVSAGAGINYVMAGNLGFTLDYAFRDVKDFPEPNHVFTVKLAFQ
jgi:hypothetical protein